MQIKITDLRTHLHWAYREETLFPLPRRFALSNPNFSHLVSSMKQFPWSKGHSMPLHQRGKRARREEPSNSYGLEGREQTKEQVVHKPAMCCSKGLVCFFITLRKAQTSQAKELADGRTERTMHKQADRAANNQLCCMSTKRKASKLKLLKSKPNILTNKTMQQKQRVLSRSNQVAFINLARTLHLSTQIPSGLNNCSVKYFTEKMQGSCINTAYQRKQKMVLLLLH